MRKIVGHQLNRNDTRFYMIVRDTTRRTIELVEQRAEVGSVPRVVKAWVYFNGMERWPVPKDAIEEARALKNAETLLAALSRMSEAPDDANSVQTS